MREKRGDRFSGPSSIIIVNRSGPQFFLRISTFINNLCQACANTLGCIG